MEQKRIGLFILSLRKEKNLTQKELADQLGVTDRAVSKWENGRGLPDVSLMKALCDVLDITVNELLSGERIDQGDYREKSEQAVLKTMESSDKTIRKKNALLWALTIGVMLLILAAVLSVYMNPVERPFFRADEEIGISLILKTVPNNETVVPYAYSNFDYADITDEIDTERLVHAPPPSESETLYLPFFNSLGTLSNNRTFVSPGNQARASTSVSYSYVFSPQNLTFKGSLWYNGATPTFRITSSAFHSPS